MDNIERRKINQMKKIEPHMYVLNVRGSQPLIIDLEDQYNSDRKPVFSRFERVKKNLLAHFVCYFNFDFCCKIISFSLI